MADFDEGKHKRDATGKFSSTGEGGDEKAAKTRAWAEERADQKTDTLAKAKNAKKDVTDLHKKAMSDGGFTYDAVNSMFPDKGFVVSAHPEHEKIIEGELTEKHLADYLESKREILKGDPKARIGAWHDAAANRWYLDISHVTEDRDEAVSVAKAHNQEAVYDLGKRETVFTKDHADRRGLGSGETPGNAGGA
jgi:hypothetical protein